MNRMVVRHFWVFNSNPFASYTPDFIYMYMHMNPYICENECILYMHICENECI